MSSFRPRRSAAVAVLAVTAAGAAALTAVAPANANAPHRSRTSLSIRAAKSVINPGGTDTVMGDLAARHHNTANRAIWLEARAKGATAWTREARHTSGAHGRVAFSVSPAATTRYRLAFLGNGFQRPSTSGVAAVRVRTDVTTLAISLDASSIESGGPEAVHGLLSHDGSPVGGQTVELHARPAGTAHFSLAGTAMTMNDGTVTFPVTPAVNTHYYLVVHKTATEAFARSTVATVHVRRPSKLAIGARLNRHGREVITGRLSDLAGHALAKRPVVLEESPAGAATWTPVAKHRSGKQGRVSFTEPRMTSSEDYMLVFAGGPNFDGSHSEVVEVTGSAV